MRILKHPHNNKRRTQGYNFFFREVLESSELLGSSGILFRLFNGTPDKTELKLVSLGSERLRMAGLLVVLLLLEVPVDMTKWRLVKLLKLTDTLLWV